MQKWNEKTVMPSGKYQGTILSDIPASHFIYLDEIFGVDRKSELGIYITENIDAIRERNEQEKQIK